MTPPDKPVEEQPEGEAQDKPKAAAKKPAVAKKPAAEKKPAAGKAAPAPEAAAEKKATARKAKAAAPKAEATPKAEAASKEKAVPKAKAAAKAEQATEPKAEKPAPSERSAARGQAAAPARRKVVSAHARYVRTSARKARMVCGHLRGKSVEEARAILAFTPREVARDWSKLLESAVANAENNHELIEEDLLVREAFADEGPTIKRFRPRAQGRATPIRKRTSHLTITLTPKA
jgi:large subunit ribosomal protein L22